MDDVLSKNLSDYLASTCDDEPPLLQHIHRETYLRETMPHMLSGHYQGRLLSLFSKMLRPNRILEIGTFTGYATLCLAEGLAENGLLHSIDINEERQDRINGYMEQAGLENRVKLHLGAAETIIPMLDERFDLVFIDADKKNNLLYYELALQKTVPGGTILIDNVLWKGKVYDSNPDKQTQQVIELNHTIAMDHRVEKIILPIRDGLFVIRKK